MFFRCRRRRPRKRGDIVKNRQSSIETAPTVGGIVANFWQTDFVVDSGFRGKMFQRKGRMLSECVYVCATHSSTYIIPQWSTFQSNCQLHTVPVLYV